MLPGKVLLSCSVTVQRYVVPPRRFHRQKLLSHPKTVTKSKITPINEFFQFK